MHWHIWHNGETTRKFKNFWFNTEAEAQDACMYMNFASEFLLGLQEFEVRIDHAQDNQVRQDDSDVEASD